uniref:Uncharacterized protein n=1 Tax=Avena sativa TaxID=4498 RepID=A0ACD5YRW9_AVESA
MSMQGLVPNSELARPALGSVGQRLRKCQRQADETMEPCAATPVRRPAELSSPTPSPLSLRQWRPAAQRNLRNQWSRLLAAKVRWLDAASAGRSHASALVNAHLSRSYMPGMDLGVLRDMPGIRDRASAKLAHKEVQCREMLLSTYKEMVKLIHAS